jgi:hypothetical protein
MESWRPALKQFLTSTALLASLLIATVAYAFDYSDLTCDKHLIEEEMKELLGEGPAGKFGYSTSRVIRLRSNATQANCAAGLP